MEGNAVTYVYDADGVGGGVGGGDVSVWMELVFTYITEVRGEGVVRSKQR